MSEKQTVLVIEDDHSISNFICRALTANDYKAIPAFRGKEGMSLFFSHSPDLVLLDLGLPDMDGMDILAQFLAEALVKSVAGGVLGIIVGTLSVELGALALHTSISYPLLLASSLGSIVFSAIIGVAGGLYPAIQASRMDVVSALRFE